MRGIFYSISPLPGRAFALVFLAAAVTHVRGKWVIGKKKKVTRARVLDSEAGYSKGRRACAPRI